MSLNFLVKAVRFRLCRPGGRYFEDGSRINTVSLEITVTTYLMMSECRDEGHNNIRP